MPIPYEKLDLKTLLYHKGAYDRIDLNGRRYINRWNIHQLEQRIFCDGGIMEFDIEDERVLYKDIKELNIIQPFLKFNEKGQHYGYELFLSNVSTVSRGDDLFMPFMARKFTYDKLPMKKERLISKYTKVCESLGIIRQTNGKFIVENYKLQKDYFDSGYNMYNGLSEAYVNKVFEAILERNNKYIKKNDKNISM